MPAKIRFVPVTREEMTKDDIRRAFVDAGPSHPLFLAMQEILIQQREDAIQKASAPDTANQPGTMAHSNGGVEWLGYAIGEMYDQFNTPAPTE